MLMIMLRACVLLSCSFLSFTASADNAVPVNVFGGVPNKANFVPTAVSRVPSNVSNHAVVTNTANVIKPVNVPTAVSRVPSNRSNQAVVTNIANLAKPVNLVPTAVSRFPSIVTAPSSTKDTNIGSTTPTNGIWLLVDTKAHKIEVKQGEQTLETITGIAIGRRGAGLKHHRGDDITPYGNYRIGWVGEKSNFHKFFGLDYPSVQDAEIALKRGIITERNYYDIVTAHQLHLVPPQDTPLGGKIGIHGLGAGDATVHQLFDWTHGCIALTNQQIDHLSQWIDTGTMVKIR